MTVPCFVVLPWLYQDHDTGWTDTLFLNRLWLCAIIPLVWRTRRLDLKLIPSVSWEAPQRTGSLHRLHPTTTSPTDSLTRYLSWVIIFLLFEMFYCFILPIFSTWNVWFLILPVFIPSSFLILPAPFSPACLYPAAHLFYYSDSQDKRASPLWGGCQTEPQPAHQQRFTGQRCTPATVHTMPYIFQQILATVSFRIQKSKSKHISVLQPWEIAFLSTSVKFLNLAVISGFHSNQPANGWLVRHSHRERR